MVSHNLSSTTSQCHGEIDQALQELALEENQAQREYMSTIRHLQNQISQLQKSIETVKFQFASKVKEFKERRSVWQRRNDLFRQEQDRIEERDRQDSHSPDSHIKLSQSQNTASKLKCVDNVSSTTKEGSVHSTVYFEQRLAAMQTQQQLAMQQFVEIQQHTMQEFMQQILARLPQQAPATQI